MIPREQRPGVVLSLIVLAFAFVVALAASLGGCEFVDADPGAPPRLLDVDVQIVPLETYQRPLTIVDVVLAAVVVVGLRELVGLAFAELRPRRNRWRDD